MGACCNIGTMATGTRALVDKAGALDTKINVLHEVEPEMEKPEEIQENKDKQEIVISGQGELQKLEQALNRVQIPSSPSELPGRKPEKNQSELPASYRENSAQEKLLMAIAENLHSQYTVLYPDRKPLMLSPVNECGVQKFVSTTLRPTLLPYPELYHWQGCASFVSEFLSLLPLDPPIDLPTQLNSPTWIIWTQQGTCFEFSTLLCSLLLGAGYDAYCVSGYAVKDMCLLNQSHQECPLIKPLASKESVEQKQKVKKYTVKPVPDLRSSFLQRQEKKQQSDDTMQQEARRLQEEQSCASEDRLYGLRVHSWVLVLAGNREVPDNFFIDPLSGLCYPTTNENFLGIESIWNHQNYWINMQDCRLGCTEITYDLGDAVKWEYMLVGSGCKSLLLVPKLNNQEECEDNDDENEEETKVFEMPPSWVDKIYISEEDMENRSPGGMKLIQYKKARVEKYAPYLLKDGLVTRLTTYNDLECTQPRIVLEWFKQRYDCLEQRKLNKFTKFTIDQFRSGRRCALKTHRYVTLVPETESQMDFYVNARLDGLMSRAETPDSMTETFQNRSDFLYHRDVVFGVLGTQQERPIKKVVERFHRNRSKPASEDVAECVFFISDGRIEVTYHLEDDRIIPAWHNFTKPHTSGFTPQTVSVFQVDPLEKPCNNLVLYQTLMTMIHEEENAIKSIRTSEAEVHSILNTRRKEEASVELHISIYDTTRSNAASSRQAELKRQAEEERLKKEKDKEVDVLAPFLAQMGNPPKLTRENAQQLRKNSLAELKQNLIDKANHIQAEFEQRTKELHQKQQWYQKNKHTMTNEDEKEYLAACSDAMFKIHVLKLRLNRHKDRAPQKYLELNEKLQRDSRLAPLLD